MKQIGLLILNTATLLFALLMNYLVNNTSITPATVGEVSARYENLFTPASYAFVIWSVIYIMLVAFVAYLWYAWVKKRNDEHLKQTGIWFMISNLANGLWAFVWTSNWVGWSVVLILILMLSLVVLMFRHRLEIWDAPVRIIAFVWWPFTIYIGWVVTATFANISSYSVYLNPDGAFALQQWWVIVMVVLALFIYAAFIYFRNMREAAFVGVWALIAIAVKQWQVAEGVAYAALITSVVLFIYAAWQGYQNKEFSPFKKYQRGEV